MPNRVLKDYTDSEAVNRLSWAAEAFFIRLIIKADENGIFAGNELLLKSRLYPLKNGVRVADISRWIAECEKAGLIRVCESKGMPFLQVAKNAQRQRISRKNDIPPQVAASCGEARQSAACNGDYTQSGGISTEILLSQKEKESPLKGTKEKKEVYSLNHPLNTGEVIAEVERHAVRITEEQAADFIAFYSATAHDGMWMIRQTPVTDWRKLITSRWLENWKNDKNSLKNKREKEKENERDYSQYDV